MNPLTLFTLMMPALDKIGSATGLNATINETLGIATPEKIMESGFRNIEGQLGNVQNTLSQHGQLLSEVQLGMTHQAAMLSGIQSSIGAIGMTAVAGCALSAVNLYQLIKIRKSLDRIEQKIDNGFLDLKIFFSEKLQDLLNEQQRQKLVQAYVYYRKGTEQLQSSLLIEESVNRKLAVSGAISIFTQSFAVYDNQEEYATINAPAKLRRLECCWAIQSAIAEAYCFQGENLAALDCYKKLRDRIYTETQNLKAEMNPANFRFILNDLHWIYKNDMLLINDKIAFLEDNSHKPQTALISIDFPEKIDDPFQGSYLAAAKLYMDCLVSPQKLDNIENAVLSSNKVSVPDMFSLQHIDLCRLYTQDILDDDEYSAPYLEPDKINTKFMLFLEEHFLEEVLSPSNSSSSLLGYFFDKELASTAEHFVERELANPIEPWIKEDSKLIEMHKLHNSQNSIYEDIHYFNYAVKSYFASAANYIRYFSQANSKDKESEKQRLVKLSQVFGLSNKFSSAIDRALLAYAQKKKPEYLKNHRDKVITTCLKCRTLDVFPNEGQLLVEYEKSVLLAKEEVKENRLGAISHFLCQKNEIINKYPVNDINPDNDVVIWDVQDTFSIKQEEAKLFIRNCQFGIEQYMQAVKTLAKNKMSAQGKTVLKEIQDENGFCDKFVAKIVKSLT